MKKPAASRAKKDAAFDKAMGVKPGSARDKKIDALVFVAPGRKKKGK